MNAEQVNRVVVDGSLPIAFSLVHQALIEDGARALAGGPDPLIASWMDNLELALPTDGKASTVEEMMHQRIGNYDAFRTFQAATFALTDECVAGLDPPALSDILVRPPYGAVLANTFSARLGGDAGITRADAVESWIYQHALRHLGEIEHARALVGLGGLTS